MVSETPRRSRRALLAAGILALAPAVALSQAAEGSAEAAGEGSAGWLALLRGIQPTLGPIFWRASVTSEYRLQMPPDQKTQRSFSEVGNLSATSYVYQPWFAQVSGNVGFVRSRSSGEPENRSSAFTGGGNLSLFPASRFPFGASFSVNDSRASGESVGADFRSLTAGIRQSYRTLDNVQFTATVDRSEMSGPAVGRDVLNVASGALSWRRGSHAYAADGQWSTNVGGASATDSRIGRLAARHTYSPASNLNVETLASYNQQDITHQTVTVPMATSARFIQLASFGTWRPEEDEPLYDEKHPLLVTASARLSAIEAENVEAAVKNVSVGGSAGLSYTINPRTRLSASASLTHVSARGAPNAVLTGVSGTLTHSPPAIPWREYTYTWNLSSGASSFAGGADGRHAVFAQASHQVSRAIALGERSQLALSAGQGLGLDLANAGGSGVSLNHNVQATWTRLGEATTQTYVSLMASDARSFGDRRSDFQLINLQATRQAPIDALSYWSANLTLQGARQRNDLEGAIAGSAADARMRFSSFGSVSYQHRRPFGIPRLRFNATYTVNQIQLQSRAQGDLEAPRHAIGDSLDARLEYQIGRLDARLSLRSATVDGKRNSGMFLRVTRYF